MGPKIFLKPYFINMYIELENAVVSNNVQMVEQLVQSGADVDFRIPDGLPILLLAILYDAHSIVQYLLQCGANPHAVSTKFIYEGYTALHLACLKDNSELTELLIIRYNVDPRVVANDGAQPIHFALLNDNNRIIQLMLEKFVDPETRLTRVLFNKYYQRSNYWSEEFGNSVTLLTFAVFCDKHYSVLPLIEHGANVQIKLSGNKTLLMVAAYYRRLTIARYLVERMNRSEINYIDDNGFNALHCIFLRETRRFRNLSPGEQSRGAHQRAELVELLINNGADMNALIRRDPSTLLVNMVAYLHDYQLLDFLLPKQKFLPIAQPLSYATMPDSVEYPSSYLPIVRNNKPIWCASYSMIDTIIKDIKLRIAMGYPVLLQEIEKLNSMNRDYLRLNDHHRVVEQLRYKTLRFKNKRLSVYEVLSKTDSELAELAQNNLFLQGLVTYHRKAVNDEKKIFTMIRVRLEQVSYAFLMDKATKLSFLPNALFYYIHFRHVLKIVEYLDVYDLRNFVNAYS